PEFIEAFRQAWDETAAEEAAKDENFKRIYDAYTAFRAEYAKWGDVGYLK
ncbi:MAG: ABC transporter substrate-binding protein, partial [Candidatus Competibacteraceae bacterium]|nr:ABC transporter substrate-binding protein [Candidatus Competibacteraceae bacterium]